MRIARCIALVFLAALLAACPGARREAPSPARPPAESAPPAGAPSGQARIYRVSAQESLLTILVYRAGPLARAGHNHVIASRDLAGTIVVEPELARSRIELTVPALRLTVDEPELRRAAGADFPPDLPESAREGTRRNMLSEAVLDAGRFERIELVSERLELAGAELHAHMRVMLRGREHILVVPVRYELGPQRLLAEGETAVRHGELGLTPFSALLGALQVQDELQIRFRIVARPLG